MTRAYGYKRNPPHVAGRLPRFGATPVRSKLTRADLRARAQIRDQGARSSCTGWGYWQAIWILSQVAAAAIVMWNLARAKEGQDLSIDDGAYPSDVLDDIQAMGWCPEADFPDTDENASRLPSLAAFIDGTAHTVKASLIVECQGAQTIADCKASIDAGAPFVCGLFVDESYQNLAAGQTWMGPDGTPGGGHYQCFVDYGIDDTGVAYFVSANSWGTGWAEGGFGRVAASVIGSMATDIEVMEAAS